MKNKTVIILLSVLAVAMYTVAVINFCLGDVLDGIGDVLMACFAVLMVFSLVMMGRVGHLSSITAKALGEFMEMLTKGVPATLTIKNGKGTITLGHDEDEDAGDEIPEEELTDEEKRVKRMAEEYDELRGRYGRLSDFLMTDTYRDLPENKRTLLTRQHQAMHDYLDVLTQRLRIEAKEANIKIDIEEPDTETAE